MRKITSNTILRPLGVNSKIFLKRTINFRKKLATWLFYNFIHKARQYCSSCNTKCLYYHSRFSFPIPVMICDSMYNSVGHFRTESRLCCVGSALYQPLLESYNLIAPPKRATPRGDYGALGVAP